MAPAIALETLGLGSSKFEDSLEVEICVLGRLRASNRRQTCFQPGTLADFNNSWPWVVKLELPRLSLPDELTQLFLDLVFENFTLRFLFKMLMDF